MMLTLVPPSPPTIALRSVVGEVSCLANRDGRDVRLSSYDDRVKAEGIKLKDGTAIGNWRVGKRLGGGGQGIVWEARPTTTSHAPPRALKVCFSDKPTDRARFEREVALLTKYKDVPHILHLVDADVSWVERVEGLPAFAFHVTERCYGSLEDLRADLGDAGARLRLFQEACAAVAFLHEQELIHRDIKPGNFLRAQEPRRLVLGDFGIARPIVVDESLTQLHEVVGTLHFRAPEAAAGQPPTVRSDVYSLGRLLEWLLTGEVSQDLDTRRVARDDCFADDVCDLLDAIVTRATSPVASKRYASVKDMSDALPDLWLALRSPKKVLPASEPLPPLAAMTLATDLAKADDKAGWREAEQDLKGVYIAQVTRWRQAHERTAVNNDEKAILAFVENLYQPIMPRLAFGLGGIVSQRERFMDQRRTVEDLLSIPNWNRGGRVLALNAPYAVGFLFHYLCGALYCELDRHDLAIELASMPIAHWERDSTRPLWSVHQLTGWPETLGRNVIMSNALLASAYERFDVIRKLFAHQADFEVALTSYSMLLSILELTSKASEISNLTDEQVRQGMIPDAPPMYLRFNNDQVKTAARRTIANAAVVRRIVDSARVAPNMLAAAWPKWVRLLHNSAGRRGRWDEWPLGELAIK